MPTISDSSIKVNNLAVQEWIPVIRSRLDWKINMNPADGARKFSMFNYRWVSLLRFWNTKLNCKWKTWHGKSHRSLSRCLRSMCPMTAGEDDREGKKSPTFHVSSMTLCDWRIDPARNVGVEKCRRDVFVIRGTTKMNKNQQEPDNHWDRLLHSEVQIGKFGRSTEIRNSASLSVGFVKHRAGIVGCVDDFCALEESREKFETNTSENSGACSSVQHCGY